MITLKTFTFNPFAENTYLLTNAQKAAWVIDPGMSNAEERDAFMAALEEEGCQVEAIVLTHAHIDHVMGCDFLCNRLGVPIWGHRLVPQTLTMSLRAAELYGVSYTPSPQPDRFIAGGEFIALGEERFEVREAPGHAPDHLVFVHHDSKTVLGGDVLFNGSVGRVDLPGGDADTLMKSIREQLYTLPDDYTVYCGHGSPTTIGAEARSNPFVRR